MRLRWENILVVLLVAGCVTLAEINSRLATWEGVDADLLASQWGAPYGSYEKKDGGKILSYSNSKVVTVGSEGFPRTQSRDCQVNVEIGPDNRIVRTSFRGAIEQCDELVVPYGGPPPVAPEASAPAGNENDTTDNPDDSQ